MSTDKITGTNLGDSLKKASLLIPKGSGEYSAHSDAMAFRKRLIHTGLVEVDINLRPMWGSRIQITGDPHMGKSLLTFMLMAAAHKTCRECHTPIIDFINDWTGESVETCLCGKKERMRVVLFDAEICFDPAWAAVWGVRIPGKIHGDDSNDGFVKVDDKINVSKDGLFTVIRTGSAEQCAIFAEQIVADHSADVVVIDSLAALNPGTRKEGKFMVGDQAKAVTRLIGALLNAQGEAFSKNSGVAPTLIFPNQKRVKIGGIAMRPGMIPKDIPGGEALKYNNTITWDLRTKYNDGIASGFQETHKYGDAVLTSKKDKDSGGTGASANYKFFTSDFTVRQTTFHPGDTDEGVRLLSFIKELGDIDKRWFRKEGAKYVILGRDFTSQQDAMNFLSRPDIVYMLRFPIYAQKFSPSMRKHLGRKHYDYTPFRDDPILELYDEAEKQVGGYVYEGSRKHTPVMLGKRTTGKPKGESTRGDQTGSASTESAEQAPG